MRLIRKRIVAAASIAGVLAVAAPVSSASAAVFPLAGGLPTVSAIGGNQIGTAGCVGTNRPSFGGNAGSTSNQTCGALLSFNGPSIGQIASVIGPTVIGASVLAPVTVSAGSPVVAGP
jgi:hypothetical protein